MTAPIVRFAGEHEFLSSFYPHPFRLPRLDHLFPTAEHAFQCAKAVSVLDYQKILKAPTAAAAKRAGRSAGCREDWEQIRHRVMLDVLLAKFASPAMAVRLAATGDAVLVEGNTWGDDHWGAVTFESGLTRLPLWNCQDEGGRVRVLAGENWLGRLLMMVREVG